MEKPFEKYKPIRVFGSLKEACEVYRKSKEIRISRKSDEERKAPFSEREKRWIRFSFCLHGQVGNSQRSKERDVKRRELEGARFLPMPVWTASFEIISIYRGPIIQFEK